MRSGPAKPWYTRVMHGLASRDCATRPLPYGRGSDQDVRQTRMNKASAARAGKTARHGSVCTDAASRITSYRT